jgi:hypothetical protein
VGHAISIEPKLYGRGCAVSARMLQATFINEPKLYGHGRTGFGLFRAAI